MKINLPLVFASALALGMLGGCSKAESPAEVNADVAEARQDAAEHTAEAAQPATENALDAAESPAEENRELPLPRQRASTKLR